MSDGKLYRKYFDHPLEDDGHCPFTLLAAKVPDMPAMYGEGRKHALQRLRSEIERQLGNHTTYPKKPEILHPVNEWIVPFERNFRFTDRESELAELESRLFANNQSTRIAVYGLGGVGKTQLVLELLYRIRDKDKSCSAIWIQATSMESLDQGYLSVARQLGIKDSGAKEVDIKKLVQDSLNDDSAGQWILVFDNADDIHMWIDRTGSESQQTNCLLDYVPRSKAGRVIFTTRDRKVGVKLAQQNVMEVPKMTESTAMRMFHDCLIDKKLLDTTPGDAKAMLAWLTHLPLAIAQAAAYINENGSTLTEYLALSTPILY
ncbi:uncharacterized protein G6M90_00g055500 [Metarhizium brunneum]|uniref:NB-ARC domain-containing protein n=1 Tax=Metarhizium brunneum TaxID=500148 RepID=A0A7D5UZ41_9HYPO